MCPPAQGWHLATLHHHRASPRLLGPRVASVVPPVRDGTSTLPRVLASRRHGSSRRRPPHHQYLMTSARSPSSTSGPVSASCPSRPSPPASAPPSDTPTPSFAC